MQLEAADRSRDERADMALCVFELSQNLAKWLTADHAEKRTLLDFLFLNLKLDGASLVPEMRKPFDMLAEGLKISSSRGDCPNFEPFAGGVATYVAVFAQSPQPYIVSATQIWHDFD